MTWGYIGAAAVGVVGSALISSNASGDAADAQQEATDKSIGEQRRQYDLTREDYAPYRAAGGRALGQLETDINAPTTAADVMADPGYQFGLQQGQQALDRKASAAGGRLSGAALKSAAEYATGYASSGFGAAYQRKQDRLNRLAALAGIGQTATSNSAAAGAASANAITGLLSAQGNAAGAAQIAQGNIWGNAVNQVGAIGQRWASQPRNTDSGVVYRNDDPYRSPGYVGGMEGE